jgi:hypothetical protein
LFAVLCLILNYVKVQGNVFYGRLNWQAFKADGEIDVRYFVFVAAMIIAWAYSSYEYNFLYNQAHLFDRLLLIAMALLVLVNPFFMPVFTFLALIIVSQFTFSGIGNYAWIDKEPVFDLLILSSVFVVLRFFVKIKPSTFIFLALCLMASFYFIPGWAKIRLGPQPWDWLLGNKLHNIFVASYLNGWLGFADQPTILDMANILKLLDIPFQVFTLIVELGSLFFLVSKRGTPLLLAGTILLHVGIFISSGIFFWKWIVVDLAFLALFWRNWNLPVLNGLFNPRYALASIVLIALSPIYFQPSWLAWFDTRLNTVYDLEVVDAKGDTYRVDRGFMAPYDVIFSQNRLYYLSNDDLITITYGAVMDFELARAIENADGGEVIEELRLDYGQNRYDEPAAQSFDRFVQTYFRNLNLGMDRRALLLLPFAPHHINSFPPSPLDSIELPIQTVRVRFVEAYYTGDEILMLQDRIIREIEIDE